MNRIFMRAAFAAVPLLLALGAPSHAQYTGDIPELSRTSVSPMIHVNDADVAQRRFTEVKADQKALDAMSESSTVRVACGVGVPTPIIAMTAPNQTVDQKLFMSGLSVSFVGGFLLAVASLFTLRWKTFCWRAFRAVALLSVGTLTVAFPFSDSFSPALTALMNGIFPFFVAVILAPKQVLMLASKLKSMFTPALPYLAPVAAVAALCCGIFAWTTGQHDRLTPVRRVHTPSVGQPAVAPVIAPIVTPPVL